MRFLPQLPPMPQLRDTNKPQASPSENQDKLSITLQNSLHRHRGPPRHGNEIRPVKDATSQ